MTGTTCATHDPVDAPQARALARGQAVATAAVTRFEGSSGSHDHRSVESRRSARSAFMITAPPCGIAGVAGAGSQPRTIAIVISTSIMVARPPAMELATPVRFSDMDANASGANVNADALGCGWGSGGCVGGTEGCKAGGHQRVLHFRPLVAFGIREVNARRCVWFLPGGPGCSEKSVAGRSFHRCRRHFFGVS